MANIVDLLNDINIISDKNSSYINRFDIKVPRVTEIISSMLHSDGLMYWANNLGFKGIRYKTALKEAADIGSSAHSNIEMFLKEKIECDSNIPFFGFRMWYDILVEDMGLTVSIIYSEHKIVCDYFGGTLDALMNIDGKFYLIDFKTSNHVTYKYFLQLAAYRYMLRVIEGINIDGVIVLQLGKDEPGFNEYLLQFSIENHRVFMDECENAFLSLVYAYLNIKRIEEHYKEIF